MVNIRLSVLFLTSVFSCAAIAQSTSQFPKPSFELADVKHKQEKSGVQVGPGNSITIVSGQGTSTAINALAFSGDQKVLAAGKDFGRVVVWDLPQRKVIGALDTGEGIVTALAVSKDGQRLITAGQGDSFRVKFWNVSDGKLLRTYDFFNGFVHSLAFGPDGTWFVAWSNDGKVHVVDAIQGKQLLLLEGMFSPLLSSDGQTLMTVGKTDYVIWNTADWSKARTLPRPPDFSLPLALNTQAGTFVVSSSGRFRLRHLDDGSLLSNSPKPELPTFNPSAGGFAAFRSGTSWLFGHSDDRLWAWNSETNQTCLSAMMYSESGALSADGSLLAGAKDNSIMAQNSSEGGVWLWNTDHLLEGCFGKLNTPAAH